MVVLNHFASNISGVTGCTVSDTSRSRFAGTSYTHTHTAAYTVVIATLYCLFTDSAQDILDKYHLNKKWYYLYGALFISAYLYVKPFVRHRIGSAESGRINFYSIYLVWLLSAWVYHLPGFAALGIDIKADVSLILLVFFGTLVVLTLLHAAYSVAAALGLIWHRLFSSSARPLDRVNILLVNSMSFALACSTYYSFCGNTGKDTGGTHLKNVCLKLRPLNSADYPAFSGWVVHGELGDPIVNATASSEWENSGESPLISPVLTLWLTLLMLFLANCACDHWACCAINAPCMDAFPSVSGGDRQRPPAKGGAGHGSGIGGREEPKPKFLPMVAWFSGTSADLLKTFFDLLISVKIFLGRFDMREMQAATSAAEINRPLPNGRDGDGFTYEHFAERDELWLDFCADTGDGGDSTYSVARAMASPELHVPLDGGEGGVTLQRGSLMVIGGDLAYPNPSDYTYENRLFRPFEDALPPPRHYHPGRVVVQKPDLPPEHPAFGLCDCDHGFGEGLDEGGTPSTPSRAVGGASWSCRALRKYEGPQCFAIPGNHDWIDGLETFMRHFVCKGWLGGWMLPQEKSYFALRLPRGWWLFGLDLGLVNDIDIFQYRYFAHLASSRLGPDDNVILVTHQPLWLLDWFLQCRQGSNLNQLVQGHLRGRVPLHLAGDLHFYMRHSLVGGRSGGAPPDGGVWPRPSTPQEGDDGDFPDHLIVNGAGGAFLHPTHVFAEASWYVKRDSAAESIASMYQCKGCGAWSCGTSTGGSPRGYSLSVPPGWEGLFPMMPAPARHLPAPVSAPTASAPPAKYVCQSSYPDPEQSKRLGRGNVHLFRRANMKFDVVGGLWYFLLVVGAAPRCQSTAAILDAPSPAAAVRAFTLAGVDALHHTFTESYVSLAACVALFFALLAFARAGGVGVVQPEQDAGADGRDLGKDHVPMARGGAPSYAEAYKIRSGGLAMQIAFALSHTAVHLAVAISLMLALDLGIETCARHGQLGGEGYHSLYNWYLGFEAEHFPDPNGVRQTLQASTMGAYPKCIKWLMAVFDLPEAIAVGRGSLCSEGYGGLTRIQALGFYLGMLAYYWVLATPAIAVVFGCYLYVCVCWFHVHYDEGFSSLRIPDHKGFTRIHISRDGTLRIWSLAIDKVPEQWAEDPRWRGFLGGSDRRTPSYKAKYPSRWLPAGRRRGAAASGLRGLWAHRGGAPGPEIRLVDHLSVRKKRPPGSALAGREPR